MNERDPAYLWDMHSAATELADALQEISLEQFLADKVLARATERWLEIIGEAARRISPDCMAANPHVPWRDIIGLRNILAHEYGQVDQQLVYATAMQDTPMLIEYLHALVEETPE